MNVIDEAIIISLLTVFLLFLLISLVALHQGLSPCDKLIGDALTIRKENIILNGKPQTKYYIEVKKGLKAVKMSIDSFQFYKPEYRNLSAIKDLRAVIHLNDSVKIEPDKIELSRSHICLEFYETVDLGSQEPENEAKVVLFSGRTPIGHRLIRTEVR